MSGLFRWLLALALALSCLGLAQASSLGPPELARLIDAAQAEVLVAAPVLRVPEVADALRRAVVRRGVRVRLLTGTQSLRDGASYFWGLRLAGAEVRTISRVSGFELIVDRRVRITGDAVGRVPFPGQVEMTLESGDVPGAVRLWLAMWARGAPAQGF